MTPEPEKSYRVWVEQRRCSWIFVTAPNAMTARDRALVLVAKGEWGLDHQRTSTSEVEEVPT